MRYCTTCREHVETDAESYCVIDEHELLKIFDLKWWVRNKNSYKPYFWNPLTNKLHPILAVYPNWAVDLEDKAHTYFVKMMQLHPEHPVYLKRL